MRCEIRDKFLIFTQFTVSEIDWIKRKLTWFEEGQSLLYFSKDWNKPYTFWGLLKPLKNIAPFPIEITNPEPPRDNSLFDIQIPNDILKGLELFDFQCESIKKAVILKKGIISCPTGGGKTEQILGTLRYLLDHQKIKTALIVVPSVGIAQQIYERARLRGFNSEEISMASGGMREVRSTKIIVGVINTLDNVLKGPKRGFRDFILGADAIIWDECHHASASRYLNLALSTRSPYLLYYSASPFKEKSFWSDPSDCLLYALAGGIIFHIPQGYLYQLGLLAQPVVYFKIIPGKESKSRGRYTTVYEKHVVKNTIRNEAICNYASKFARLKFPVLILVQRIEHARILMESLKDYRVMGVLGSSKSLIFEQEMIIEAEIDYNQFRADFERGAYEIIIASQVMDEGMDLPAIGAVILAGGGKSRVKQLQRAGRGLRRKKTGKNCVYILDFYDQTHIFLTRHSKKRIDLFEEMEAHFPSDEIGFLQQVIDHSVELKNATG